MDLRKAKLIRTVVDGVEIVTAGAIGTIYTIDLHDVAVIDWVNVTENSTWRGEVVRDAMSGKFVPYRLLELLEGG